MSRRPNATRVKKDALIELVSRDIKELQKAQSGFDDATSTFTNTDTLSQLLCDHLDHVLMHGLRECEDGYWPFVSYFTRNELVHTITRLKRVTTSIGKGRSWLYTALNEQSMESYVRMFAENQTFVQEFYLRDAFMRDIEHLLLLLTLVAGLDFISFGLEVDCDYLDYGASQLSSQITSQRSLGEVQPSFLSTKVSETKHVRSRRSSDPTPKQPQALPSSEKHQEASKGDMSASYAGTVGTSEYTELHSSQTQVETENKVVPQSKQQISSEAVSIPSTERSRTSMMSSSLQMMSSSSSPSSKNVLERMSSLESRSLFLERAVRDGRSKLERGSEGVRMGGGEGVRGDVGEGGGDEILVARERRHGKGKKKRRKRREETENGLFETVTESSLTGSRTNRRDHVTEHESHVTKHMTTQEHRGKMAGSDGKRVDQRKDTRTDRDRAVNVSASGGLESGVFSGAAVSVRRDEREGEGSIPCDTEFLGTEECDFETEPKHAVSALVERREGGGGRGREDGGGEMSLEMELALASRDIESPVRGNVSTAELEDRGVVYGDDSKELCDNNDGVESVAEGRFSRVTETGTVERGFGEIGDGDGTANPSTPISPSHTLIHHPHTRMRHTAPAHSCSQHPKSKMKVVCDNTTTAQHKSQLRKSVPQKARVVSPEFEEGFDVISRTEVREVLGGRRGRANAVFTEERDVGEGDGGEGEAKGRDRETGSSYNVSTNEGTHLQAPTHASLSDTVTYDGPPKRPKQITEEDRRTNDIEIDDNMKVMFSIDVYLSETDRLAVPDSSDDSQQRVSMHAEEDAKRLVQVNTPVGLGQYRVGYILVTTEAVYLLRRDGIEGTFSRDFGARYSDIDHLVIGLGWQSIELVYVDSSSRDMTTSSECGLQSCVTLTGSEAVSRSLMDSIQTAATECPGFQRVIPKNRDDETRISAIERELIKLGSETNMDIVQYSFVNWEQVKGESPESLLNPPPGKELMSGLLYFKSTTVLGRSSWKQAFFELKDGTLFHYNSETDRVLKATYPLAGCGGCTRLSGESKPFVLSVALSNTQPLLLATTTEDDLSQWIQTLCEAVQQVPSSRPGNLMCTVLLTKSKVHILQEDLSSGTVYHITCCDVTSIEGIGVDRYQPQYCTISYDDSEGFEGVWLLCFNSEYELGKFEAGLSSLWTEQFQICLPFSELEELTVRQRAHQAIDLMRSSGLRCDSITKGRTEFTYSSAF